MTHTPVPGPPAPGSIPVSDVERAVTDLAEALPGLPLAEHHDRLAGLQELLQHTLDEVHTGR